MDIIFGPIYSRRFGKSLGIDLSPGRKQCNYDCLYCELAPAKTITKYDDIVSVNDIITALKHALLTHDDVDVITLTANGEPTLYPYLSELIDEINSIKGNTQTLILSNGSTIADKSVQDALVKLDSVKLSLDCATNRCLKKLDRSHAGITIESIKSGMLAFRARYKKPFIIETLFVKNLNDKPDEIEQLNSFLLQLQPKRVDIGTIDRPPAYDVQPLSYDELLDISQLFDASLPIYIASRKKIESKPKPYSEEQIMQTLSKRPLTPEDIEILFDEESKKTLHEMLNRDLIQKKEINGVIFYILFQKPLT